jgi:hypothetical protein
MSGAGNGDKNLDIGFSARASLEARISTEIPSQSSGRLLDTVTDMFRPFAERRGLKADLIRLQREEVLIEITLLHGSAGERSERHLVRSQARRTYSGRPSSSMRFST